MRQRSEHINCPIQQTARIRSRNSRLKVPRLWRILDRSTDLKTRKRRNMVNSIFKPFINGFFAFIGRIVLQSRLPSYELHAFRGVAMDLATAELWMQEALSEARKAKAMGEVQVGAVVLLNEKIIGRGYNSPIQTNDPTAHAEIVAVRQAARNSTNYRLPGSILIVTIEPCIMCVGAMIQARVEHLIYGAADPKAGAVRSCYKLADNNSLNHKIHVTSGILEKECGSLMRSFFASRR
jgi:tRNA(adenine34) deaminase